MLTLLADPRHRRQTATTTATVTAGILVLGQPPTLHFNWHETWPLQVKVVISILLLHAADHW